MVVPGLPVAEKESGTERRVLSKSSEETIGLGQTLAAHLQAGDVVAFFGELGSGKSTFITGVCQGLECIEAPSSPTFTLINEYAAGIPIYHFDFYRIAGVEEALELGCDEYFSGEGVCLIEWAEKIVELLPQRRYEVYLHHLFRAGHEDSREIRIVTP
ncbi:MAG: tRNA (adenosine(37)-N6)-threonylcarbamoyltransferase complex ATPase subunit type 1 TsaE [bacterium]